MASGLELKKKWEAAKRKAEKVVPKGFIKGEDLGSKLGAADESFEKYSKEKDVAKEAKLKKKAGEDGHAASTAATEYLRLLELGVRANKNDKNLYKALYEWETTLSMQIIVPLDARNKNLGV